MACVQPHKANKLQLDLGVRCTPATKARAASHKMKWTGHWAAPFSKTNLRADDIRSIRALDANFWFVLYNNNRAGRRMAPWGVVSQRGAFPHSICRHITARSTFVRASKNITLGLAVIQRLLPAGCETFRAANRNTNAEVFITASIEFTRLLVDTPLFSFYWINLIL